MADYKKALLEGFEAAKNAELAKKEVQDVLGRLKAEILEWSGGKLLVEIREFPEEETPIERTMRHYAGGVFGREIVSKKTFWAVMATNPLAANQSFKELARWKQAKDGYPCTLIWNNQERQFEDRVALEEGLAELLRDPLVGEKLYALINQQQAGASEAKVASNINAA